MDRCSLRAGDAWGDDDVDVDFLLLGPDGLELDFVGEDLVGEAASGGGWCSAWPSCEEG